MTPAQDCSQRPKEPVSAPLAIRSSSTSPPSNSDPWTPTGSRASHDSLGTLWWMADADARLANTFAVRALRTLWLLTQQDSPARIGCREPDVSSGVAGCLRQHPRRLRLGRVCRLPARAARSQLAGIGLLPALDEMAPISTPCRYERQVGRTSSELSSLDDPTFRRELLVVASFLAGDGTSTRNSYATDLRLFADWCSLGRARSVGATVDRRQCSLSPPAQ